MLARISQKKPRILLLLIGAVLLTLFLYSCVTVEYTSMAIPTISPGMMNTYTPESVIANPELTIVTAQAIGDGKSGILLPSETPARTAIPGVISQMVHQFKETRGLEQTTILGINVEEFINLLVSIFMALLVGLLISRLVYFALKKAAAQTELNYDDVITRIQHQLTLVVIVFGLQFVTFRLSFIDVGIKQIVNMFYITIYVVVATIILWHLLDILVEWREYHLLKTGIASD